MTKKCTDCFNHQHPTDCVDNEYLNQEEVDRALAIFSYQVGKGIDVSQGLLMLVKKGVDEHLSGKKAWKVKTGRRSQSPRFLAAYLISKEIYSNQEIADRLGITLETAKGFRGKAAKLTGKRKGRLNGSGCLIRHDIERGFSVLDILEDEYIPTVFKGG